MGQGPDLTMQRSRLTPQASLQHPHIPCPCTLLYPWLPDWKGRCAAQLKSGPDTNCWLTQGLLICSLPSACFAPDQPSLGSVLQLLWTHGVHYSGLCCYILLDSSFLRYPTACPSSLWPDPSSSNLLGSTCGFCSSHLSNSNLSHVYYS